MQHFLGINILNKMKLTLGSTPSFSESLLSDSKTSQPTPEPNVLLMADASNVEIGTRESLVGEPGFSDALCGESGLSTGSKDLRPWPISDWYLDLKSLKCNATFLENDKLLTPLGGRHSSVDPAAITILQPRVRIPSTTSILFSITFSFKMLGSFILVLVLLQ